MKHTTNTKRIARNAMAALLWIQAVLGASVVQAQADRWKIENEQAASRPGIQSRTYLEFIKTAEAPSSAPAALTAAVTTPILTTLAPTSPTVGMMEGVTTAAGATTLPAWLTGPTTGMVEGIPLPLSLENCVALALKHNFDIQTGERDVLISQSFYRQEQFEFVPFVDLFSGYRYTDSKTGLTEGSGLERTFTQEANVGVRVTQKFPTGGDISIRQELRRTRMRERYRIESVDPVSGRVSDVSRDSVVTRQYENSIDIVARQPLLRGGGLKVGLANLRLARLGRIQSVLNYEVQRRNLILAVIRAYFAILQRQLDVRVSLDAIREKKRFYDETVTKHELGEIAESEVWRAKILWLQEQQRSRQLQQGFLDSLDTLLVLMGLPLDTPLRLREFTGRVLDLAELGLTSSETCVREALANRPELLAADLEIRRARISVEVARNGTWPFLDLEATYSDTEYGRHLEDVRDLDNRRRWSIGALFDLPFPNMANREALKRARYRLEQAKIRRQSLERDIAEGVRRLYRALETNRARIDILAETVALAERSLQLENARFYYGENTSIDVRNAQDDLFQARSDYNNALLRYQADLASLYHAIGWSLYQPLKQ